MHNSGKNLSTKPFRLYQLIFYESFLNKEDAKNREAHLKGGYCSKTIRKMLKTYSSK
jgi:putative endonuclease